MNMFDILTKLATIVGEEKPTIKEWGGDPADLEDPNSPWFQGRKSAPDRDPGEERSELIDSWTDAVVDEFEHYQNWDQMTDDQLERLSEIIAADLGAPEEIVHVIISGHASGSRTDHSMRQGEMGNYKEDQGSEGVNGAHGENMEHDLTMESLRYLSGVNKTITECGIPTATVGGSHIPASINITASSGPELTGMLKDIMSLAGVKSAEPDHKPIDVLAKPAEVDHMPGGPNMAALIRAVDEPEMTKDSMNDEVEVEGMPEKTENRPWDSSPHEKERQDGVRKFGDANSGDHRERQAGLARAKPTVESIANSLFAEYEKFISEIDKK